LEKATHRQVLLVSEDQEERVPQFVLVQHPLQLLTSLDHTVAIVAVHDEDDTLGVLEVMPPKGPDLVLPTNIPYGKLDVLVLDCLNVETCFAECKRIRSLEMSMRRPRRITHQ